MSAINETNPEGSKEQGWVKVSRKLFEDLLGCYRPSGKIVEVEWGEKDRYGYWHPKITVTEGRLGGTR